MAEKNQKLMLFVNHHVYLEPNERAVVANGGEIDCIGVSVPVWLHPESGNTSEPAAEIFCKYRLRNVPGREWEIETPLDDGYTLYLPQLPESFVVPPFDVEAVATLNEQERRLVFSQRDQWFNSHPTPPHPGQLRDISQGGSEMMQFEIRLSTNMPVRNRKFTLDVAHNIEIKDISRLLNSLTD